MSDTELALREFERFLVNGMTKTGQIAKGNFTFSRRVPPCPESLVVRNRDELLKKLEEAHAEVERGNVFTVDEVFERLNSKYGLQA